MSPLEHYREAERLIDTLVTVEHLRVREETIALAQVHATLAMAPTSGTSGKVGAMVQRQTLVGAMIDADPVATARAHIATMEGRQGERIDPR